MNRIALLILLLPVMSAVEPPPSPIERTFRFLVVDDNGKPAEGVPLLWISDIENGFNAFGGRRGKEVERRALLSGRDGVVEIPKHTFSTLQTSIKQEELKNSTVWMVDSKTNSQSFRWDVYNETNPYGTTIGQPTPGFDAVFKVLSKQGLSDLAQYYVNDKQVPCDGTPTPLRVLGGPSSQVTSDDQTDVVITINRPGKFLKPGRENNFQLVEPQRMTWAIEAKTLLFAHFSDAANADLTADYRTRTWTSRIEVQPSHVDSDYGSHGLTLWALLPGEKPLVFPMRCEILASMEALRIGRPVYTVKFKVVLPIGTHTRFHPDVREWPRWLSLTPELDPGAIAPLVDPIRSKALHQPYPGDLTTVPVLRYDTYPIPPGKDRLANTPAVLLPADKP